MRISSGTEGGIGLGPVSVAPVHQDLGIGSTLVREALRHRIAARAGGCVALGEPAYYGRFGFCVPDGLLVVDIPRECFQAVAFHGDGPRGAVTYRAAFAASS